MGAGDAGEGAVLFATVVSASFRIGAIKCSLREGWAREHREDRALPLYLYMVGRLRRSSHSTQVLR